MRARLLAIVAVSIVSLGPVACGGQGEEVATQTLTTVASPSPTVSASASPDVSVSPSPTVSASPSPSTAACVAGSTPRLLEIRELARFRVYCPTFLPSDLTFVGAEYGGGVWLPLTDPATLEATFVDAAGTRKVRFIQGPVDLDLILRQFTATGKTIMYGDLEAQVWESRPEVLFEPLLMAVATSEDGFTYWVDAHGFSEEELEQMAAGMKPLVP